MNDWIFGPKLRRMFEAYGVPWQVLDRVLTPEELEQGVGVGQVHVAAHVRSLGLSMSQGWLKLVRSPEMALPCSQEVED